MLGFSIGAFGIPKPWNFPFTKSYWIGGIIEEQLSPEVRRHPFVSFMLRGSWWRNSQRTPFLARAPSGEQPSGEQEKDWRSMFEEEPSHLPLGVSITKLCKKYKNAAKFAVHNFNLNLYEGQITALLGPTGKDTLL